jgi:diamine N-acetyltransferase
MASATVAFRAGTPADALCVGVLATQVFLDTYATDGIRPDLAREVLAGCSPEACAARLADRQVSFVLAETPGHLVGFAEIHHASACPAEPKADAELVRLYVQQPFQRQGIGAALLRLAEQRAHAAGAGALWLSAWCGNARALAFYPALGYKDVGATEYVIEGRAYPNRLFLKSPLTISP